MANACNLANQEVDFAVYNSMAGPGDQVKQARNGKTNTKWSHSHVESKHLVLEKSRRRKKMINKHKGRQGGADGECLTNGCPVTVGTCGGQRATLHIWFSLSTLHGF